MGGMTDQDTSYIRSASTTCLCEKCRLRGAPAPRVTAGAQRPRLRFFPSRDARKPLQLSLRFVQAAEDRWVIECRGAKWQVCGSMNAGDVFRWINGSYYR